MSAASLVMGAMPPLPRVSADRDWISLSEAARILGRSTNPSAVKSIALAGGIKTRSIPGLRTVYFRPDVERLADPH
jgi:hypothetical protein